MRKIEVTTETYQGFSGDIIVTDPCYFIPDDIWQEIINKFWYPNGNQGSETANAGTIYIDSTIKILYTATAFGDGEYDVINHSGNSVHKGSTGVDAGMVAIITVADAQKLNPEFDVNNDFYPRINGFTGGVEADGNGNFVGDIIVDTSSTEEEEDTYDEEFEDEYEPEDEE